MYDTRYGDPVPRILHKEIKPCTNYNGRKKNYQTKVQRLSEEIVITKIFFPMEISFDYWETVNSFKKVISPLARFFLK